MRLSLKWNVVPFVVTSVFVLVGAIILLYNNSISPHGEGPNWPSPGSAAQWGQYISIAILSLLALIVDIIGVIKNNKILLRVTFGVFALIAALVSLVTIMWMLNPTPY